MRLVLEMNSNITGLGLRRSPIYFPRPVGWRRDFWDGLASAEAHTGIRVYRYMVG